MLPIADQKTVSVSNPCSGNGYHTRGNCHSVARWSEQSGVISLRLRRDSMLRSWEWKFLCLSPKHIFLSFLLSWGDQILLKLSKPVLSSSSWPSTCCCSPALMVRKKGPGQSRFGVEKTNFFTVCVSMTKNQRTTLFWTEQRYAARARCLWLLQSFSGRSSHLVS